MSLTRASHELIRSTHLGNSEDPGKAMLFEDMRAARNCNLFVRFQGIGAEKSCFMFVKTIFGDSAELGARMSAAQKLIRHVGLYLLLVLSATATLIAEEGLPTCRLKTRASIAFHAVLRNLAIIMVQLSVKLRRCCRHDAVWVDLNLIMPSSSQHGFSLGNHVKPM